MVIKKGEALKMLKKVIKGNNLVKTESELPVKEKKRFSFNIHIPSIPRIRKQH